MQRSKQPWFDEVEFFKVIKIGINLKLSIEYVMFS